MADCSARTSPVRSPSRSSWLTRLPLSPRFAPGAAYEYSNTNTVLLGMIVEQ